MFPDTQVGVTSSPKSVTVLNEGGADLTFSSLPTVNGANGGDFAVDQTTATACGTTTSLPTGATCTVTATFTPTDINTRTATLRIVTNGGTMTVPLTGTSSITADGTFDPVRLPHAIDVFPVRDYVGGAGFAPTDRVQMQVFRNNVLIGESQIATPVDVDLTDLKFDGFVEVNHVGGVCWSGSTPDIQTGDVVRAVRMNVSLTVLGTDQTHVQGVDVTMPATAVNANTVVMTGRAVDVFTGQPLAAGSFEPRITSTTTLFDLNGRRDVRGLDGVVTMNGSEWTATFSGLTAADVTRMVTGDSKVVWLGRNAAALNELTHSEFGEIPGPDPLCAPTAPFNQAEPVLAPALLNTGYSGVGTPGVVATATFTNPGPGAISMAVGAVEGLNAGDFQVVGGSCGIALAANASCTINVRLTASALGTRVASLPVTHTGANGISHLLLQGIGVSAPTITMVAPSPAGHGSVITVTGSALTSTTGVTVGGAPAVFAVIGDTTVTAVVPAAAAPAAGVAVTVTTAGGNATNSTLTVLPDPPTITTVSPSTGIINASVIITGANFNGASVAFNGVAASVLAGSSNTRINTRVPVGATTGNITVTTGSGVATAPFTVIPGPLLTSFTPATDGRGAQVVLNGANFTATTTVSFTISNGGTVNATPTVLSATQIRVTVPNTAVQGPVRVSNTAGSSSLEFVVELAPTISSFTPTQAGVGATVTINGNNFRTTNRVQFNGRNATFTVVSPTQLTAVVPAGATTGRISVGNQWGSGTSAANFTVIPAPTITSFTPVTGTRGVTVVTVTGTGLNFVNAASLVQGLTVVPVTITSLTATQLRFTIPAATTVGLYNIRVTSLGGTATSVANLTVS